MKNNNETIEQEKRTSILFKSTVILAIASLLYLIVRWILG